VDDVGVAGGFSHALGEGLAELIERTPQALPERTPVGDRDRQYFNGQVLGWLPLLGMVGPCGEDGHLDAMSAQPADHGHCTASRCAAFGQRRLERYDERLQRDPPAALLPSGSLR
jgi:hypothetical protein